MLTDSSITIRSFRVRAVRVPMTEPHRAATGEITESPLVLTDVVTDADVTGHSMVFTYTQAALKPTAGLTWVEEPTLAHDYAGHALVTREARTPIQCGENWWGVRDMQHGIEAQASDFMMPDVMKIGGVTGWLRAAALAHAKGIPVSSHLWPEVSSRLLCCTPTAHWLEYADWWNPILAEPLVVENGMAMVGDAVGTGVEWNEKAVDRFAV